jgi:hypothetical protein
MSYGEDHVAAFNHAVRTGAWRSFTQRFAENAVLEFIGPPVGPFIGRDAILDAYIENPPDDTIQIAGAVVVDGPEVVIPYRWDATGATGTMFITRQSDKVEHLTITFD